MLGNLYPNLDNENKENNKNKNKTKRISEGSPSNSINRRLSIFTKKRSVSANNSNETVQLKQPSTQQLEVDLKVEDQDSNNNQEQSQDQMDFGLQTQRIYSIDRVKQQLNRWENIIEVLPYWKLAINPVNLTVAVATSLIIAFSIYFQSGLISDDAILFYSQIDDFHLAIPKILFLTFPILVVVFQVILLRLERFVFNFDQRLSTVLSSSQIFINILSVIAIIQLLSLMLS